MNGARTALKGDINIAATNGEHGKSVRNLKDVTAEEERGVYAANKDGARGNGHIL